MENEALRAELEALRCALGDGLTLEGAESQTADVACQAILPWCSHSIDPSRAASSPSTPSAAAITTTGVSEEEAGWQQWVRAGEALLAAGDFAAAEPLFFEALRLSRDEHGTDNVNATRECVAQCSAVLEGLLASLSQQAVRAEQEASPADAPAAAGRPASAPPTPRRVLAGQVAHLLHEMGQGEAALSIAGRYGIAVS